MLVRTCVCDEMTMSVWWTTVAVTYMLLVSTLLVHSAVYVMKALKETASSASVSNSSSSSSSSSTCFCSTPGTKTVVKAHKPGTLRKPRTSPF